jgi:hypothetical protein
VRDGKIIDALKSPWPFVVAVLVGLSAGAARAPLATALVVSSIALIAVLVWRFGGVEGLWYLFLAAIPFREPLSIEIYGTVSMFFGDVLLLALVVTVAHASGVSELWRRSPVFKIGVAIVALSLVGLFTATRFFWGIASIYRIVGQLAVFYVASHVIRSPRVASRSLLAVVLGLVPAYAYGLHQATLPYGASLPEWSRQMSAWDPSGARRLRAFATFDHPLHYAHYLSIGFAVALGLAVSRLSRGLRFLSAAAGAGAAYAGFFTYSIGGIVGVLTGAVTVVFLKWRRAAVFAVPAVAALLVVASPAAQTRKLNTVLTGEAATGAARLITLRQATAIMRDHPLTGVGWGGIRSSLEHEYRVTRGTAIAYTAENYFFVRGMALGLPGVALYVALLALFARNVLRSSGDTRASPWPRAAVIAGGAAFYVQAQAIPGTQATANYVIWLLFAIAERMASEARAGAGGRAGA